MMFINKYIALEQNMYLNLNIILERGNSITFIIMISLASQGKYHIRVSYNKVYAQSTDVFELH